MLAIQPRPSTHRLPEYVGVALAIGCLVGCTGGTSEGPTSPPAPGAPAPATDSGGTGSGGAGSGGVNAGGVGAGSAGTDGSGAPGDPAAASPAAPTPTALPSVATRKGSEAGGAQVEVTLNSVVAGGKLMTVTWTARNAGSTEWRVDNYFAGEDVFESRIGGPGLQANVAGTADGVTVLDKASGKRYLAATTPDGNCVCSTELVAVQLQPGGSAILESVYQAPPAEVSEVDVSIPHVGTFTNVPVTR